MKILVILYILLSVPAYANDEQKALETIGKALFKNSPLEKKILSLKDKKWVKQNNKYLQATYLVYSITVNKKIVVYWTF